MTLGILNANNNTSYFSANSCSVECGQELHYLNKVYAQKTKRKFFSFSSVSQFRNYFGLRRLFHNVIYLEIICYNISIEKLFQLAAMLRFSRC